MGAGRGKIFPLQMTPQLYFVLRPVTEAAGNLQNSRRALDFTTSRPNENHHDSSNL